METPSIPQLPEAKGSFPLLKKEKGIGTVGLILLGVGALLGLNQALPFIINFLNMAITATSRALVLGLLGVLVFAFGWVIMQPRTWTLFYYAYSVFSRQMTKALIKYNPIAMLKAYSSEYLQQKLAAFRSNMTGVAKQKHKIQVMHEEKVQELEEAKERANFVKDRSYDSKTKKWDIESYPNDYQTFIDESSKIVPLESLVKKLQGKLNMLETLIAILTKFQRTFESRIKAVDFWVDMLEVDYEASKGAAEATQSVMSLFGADDKKQVFDMAVEYVQGQIGQFVGQVETFMAVVPDFLRGTDLESDMNVQKLLNQLETWDQTAQTLEASVQDEQSKLESGDPQQVKDLLVSRIPQKSLIPPRRKYFLGGK